VDLVPIHNDPDEAGLMGAVHLAPAWMFKAFGAVLGVDIGGTNMRAGVIQINLKKAPDLSKSKVWKFSLWRHGDEEGVKREHAVDSLVEMLKGLIAAAGKKGVKLAPFIGIGCPGVIEGDGSIDRGAQNLPGNWQSKKFNLPLVVHSQIPRIGDEDTSIVLHNDAVVQGLSEVPYMHDVERWGYLQSAPASATPASPIVGKESLRAQVDDARYVASGRNSIQPVAKSLWHENEQSIRQGTGR